MNINLCLLNKKNFYLILLILIFANPYSLKAQKFTPNSEFGIMSGASYYLGDLNSNHFKHSKLFAGIALRKNIDRRFVYKAEILLGNLYGDDRENKNSVIAQDRSLHFKSQIQELSGQIEFNFLPYETGNSLFSWTPFVFTGVSLFRFNPKAESKYGEWVNLQELGTEGQGSPAFPDRKKYSLIQFSIPMGVGFKLGINKSFNIILQYGARKTFTDYIDDVSMTYPGSAVLFPEGGNLAVEMSDPTGTHLIGQERGNSENNDWYSFFGITLSFKLPQGTQGCDY